MDKMRPVERIKLAVEHKQPDRVPVFPVCVAHAAKNYGITYRDYCTSAENLARAAIHCSRTYGLDGVFVQACGWQEAEAMGVELYYPEDNAPSGKAPIVKTREELKKLRVPDPLKDGRMPMVVKANELVVKEVGHELYVKSQIDQAPFALACELVGFEQAFLLMYDDPSFLHELLEICTETQIRYGKAIASTGVHNVFMGEAIASQISPAQYKEFSLPYNRRVIDAMHELGVTVTLHTCGNSSYILELMADTGADIIEFDSMVDIAEAKRRVGDRVCLQGNVDTGLVLQGTPDEVEAAAKDCIEKAASGGGFILACGCEPAPNTPQANLHALVAAAKKYGRYPITQ